MNNRGGYTNEDLRSNFPDMSEEDRKYLSTKGIRFFTPKEKGRALQLLGQGMNQREVCRSMKKSMEAFVWTCKVYPEFKAEWNSIKKNRGKQIESKATQYLLGSIKTEKITYLPQRNKVGEVITDQDGKPFMQVAKREIKKIPPSADLLKLYLQTHCPEWKPQEAENNLMPGDELEAMIQAIRKLHEPK